MDELHKKLPKPTLVDKIEIIVSLILVGYVAINHSPKINWPVRLIGFLYVFHF